MGPAMRSAPILDGRRKSGIEATTARPGSSSGFAGRIGAFLLHEFLEILPPTIFFLIGFNLIVLTTNLILADYGAQVASFIIATTSALVVAKAVLVANAMPAIRRYDRAPLIRPILFTYRPSELQLNRRQRIYELVRLGKLADAHSMDEFRDPTSAAHTQLVDIVRRLAVKPRPLSSDTL